LKVLVVYCFMCLGVILPSFRPKAAMISSTVWTGKLVDMICSETGDGDDQHVVLSVSNE
jgi:hypothetical protein